MLHKINGLPAHILLIHAVVVLLPLGALMLVAGAVWPAARARFGFLTPLIALVALVLVPITTQAGEWLQNQLPNNFGHTDPRIVKHAHLGEQLLPWAAGIFVMAAVVWVLDRRYELSWRPSVRAGDGDDVDAPSGGGTALAIVQRTRTALPVWVAGVVAALSLVVAVGGVVQIVRIGDSGAKAVWSGTVK